MRNRSPRNSIAMVETFVEGNFLGIPESDEDSVDVVILSLPYELTTSYGQGTVEGPRACIEASGQVELFDSSLSYDLPAGSSIFTAEPWDGEGSNLLEQLDRMTEYLIPWFNGDCFPLILGGEHGILPSILQASINHPEINGDLSRMTVLQIDAHADLREKFDDEPYSHACAASRALDLGIGNLLQVGVRAFSREEAIRIDTDERISTWFAKDLLSPCDGNANWADWIDTISKIEGPVHLTVDIDGLDGSLVPNTGTPVPGGLHYWHLVETIEHLFANLNAIIISADVNEIVPGKESKITQFSAAMMATKILVSHLSAKESGNWNSNVMKNAGKLRVNSKSEMFFQTKK